MKLKEKEKALRLRRKGLMYKEILQQVDVSKSTLNMWFRELPNDAELNGKILKGREKSRQMAAQKRRRNREEITRGIIQEGKEEFEIMLKNPLFLAGLCLYWAEGDKHKKERVKFTNADEKMIAFMMKWFREVCKVPEEKFRIALHLHNLHVATDAETYWSNITGVPKKQFQKTYIKQSSLRHRRNILYNGTCGIVVSNKALFRRISGWKLGFLDHFHISPL